MVIALKSAIIKGMEVNKNKKFSEPKKVKNTNGFLIKLKLLSDKTLVNKVATIKLVIKNQISQVVFSKTKEIKFVKNQLEFISFYAALPERVKLNKNYYFLIYANNNLIKYETKVIR